MFHLGALASVAKSVEDPILNHAVNATGTLNVLNAARKLGVRRVVYAGSASAYGGADDPAGQDESTPLCALSPYAAAKLTGEHYCSTFTHVYGMEAVRLRYFNVNALEYDDIWEAAQKGTYKYRITDEVFDVRAYLAKRPK